MSIVTLQAETTIAHIVEAMLPRFSDSKLGLYVNVQLDFIDHGYGSDGDTLEREGLAVRSNVHFLFVRPSNYTQVYVLVDRHDDFEDIMFPLNGSKIFEWTQTSNHDSCWRSDGFRPLTDEYFRISSQFSDREVDGKKMAPKDIFKLNGLNYDPTYVEVDINTVNPEADRYSKESRQFMVDMTPIPRYRLEQVGYKADRSSRHGDWIADITSGMLIKGSESHEQIMKTKERADNLYGALQ